MNDQIGHLATLIDYAHRRQLVKYDDGRAFVFVAQPKLWPLEKVAALFLRADRKEVIEHLLEQRIITVYQSLKDVPGDDFYCIYFEDAYFLSTYQPGGAA